MVNRVADRNSNLGESEFCITRQPLDRKIWSVIKDLAFDTLTETIAMPQICVSTSAQLIAPA
jgi:hypothetical protein